jgi:hypothetical protein
MATFRLLSDCYSKVLPINEFIREIIPSARLLDDDDPESFRILLQNCTVTRRNETTGNDPVFKFYPPDQSQFEV